MLKYLIVSNTLFFIGVVGLFLVRKHIIIMLLSLELMFLAVSFNFIVFSVFFDDLVSQFYVICILVVAAAESSLGLAILVVFYRLRGGISLDLLKLLKN